MSNDLSFTISAKDQASKAVETVQKKIQNLGTDLAKGFLSFAAPLTLVQTGFSMITDAIAENKKKVADSLEAYSGITDKAAEIGVATDEFLRLNQAAEASGVGVNKVAKLFQEVTTIIEQATQSGSSQEKMLKALGFSAEEIASGLLKPIQVIEQMGIAMNGASTNTDRMALATAMLGKNAADLIPVLLKAQQVAQGYGEDPGITQDEIALIEEKKRKDKQAKNKEEAKTAREEVVKDFLQFDAEGKEIYKRTSQRLQDQAGTFDVVTVSDVRKAAEEEVLAVLKKRREEAARLRQEAGAASIENLNELEMQRLNTEAVALALEDLAKMQADADKDKEAADKKDKERTKQELDDLDKLKEEKAKATAKELANAAKLTVSSLREIGGGLAGEFAPSQSVPDTLKTIAETDKEILKAIVELKDAVLEGKLEGVDFTKDPKQTTFIA